MIGFSVGLMLSIAATLEILLSLHRSALIVAYSWDKVMLLFPFLLLMTGLFLLLYRGKTKA
jgi:hypothetical protein